MKDGTHYLSVDSVDDTMSLSSEVTRYRVENYRRYHAFDEEKYFQPNDAQAQDHEGKLLAKSPNVNLKLIHTWSSIPPALFKDLQQCSFPRSFGSQYSKSPRCRHRNRSLG